MRAPVFVGSSLDGFIARRNGDLDFLPPGGGEPHGYDEFITSVDAIVIGRQTFETVLTMKPWPYGDKRVVVLSSRPVEFSAVVGGVVEQMAGSPAEIVAQLAATGAKHVYIDGGITIQQFLRAGFDSTSDYHSRARAHWSRNFSLWLLTTRHSPPSYRDQALPERFGEQRVRC